MEASALHAPSVSRFRSSAGPAFLRLRSDEQLVELFRAGHEDAFRVIHDRYRVRLFAYTRQMLPNSRSDAEDALQDVFIRAYAGLRANNRQLALRAWLYRVAHNRCVDQLRKSAPILTEEFETPSQDVSTDPMAAVEQREDLRKLVTDVQRLPEQQRSALLMREMSGMSYQELADSMGLSVPAIKSLLVRARTGLTAAAEARDTDCGSIRAEIVDSHERGTRPNALARRHLNDCVACREYRESVRGVSASLAALIPAGPLVLGLKLLGIGSVYSAAAYSGSAGGGAAAAAGGAAAGGAAVGGAAAGGAAAVGGVTAGGAVVGGVSATHIAAIIAAAAATAGGAVAVTHQTTPHRARIEAHPAAGVIATAVHRGVAGGYAPAAAVTPVTPVQGIARTPATSTAQAKPAVSPLTHTAPVTTTPATTSPAGTGTTTTPATTSTVTTATGSVTTAAVAPSGSTATPAASTTSTPTAAPGTAPAGTAATNATNATNATVSTPAAATTTSPTATTPAGAGAAATTSAPAAASTTATPTTPPASTATSSPSTTSAVTDASTDASATTASSPPPTSG